MPDVPINFIAISVAALAPILVGLVWYSPFLFGKQWSEAHGYDRDELQERAGRSLIISFACYLVMAYVLSAIFSMAGIASIADGMALTFLLWLGFLATLGLTAHLFSEKPFVIYLIDTSFQLVYVLLMGIILSAWPS